MKIQSSVLEALLIFQNKAPSYIVGGYLRDLLCDIKPYDVDIATEMSLSEVKRLFPQLSTTEKGSEFGVGRFQYQGLTFEVSTYTEKSFLDSLCERDFTINSIYHDGKTLIIPKEAEQHLQEKRIVPISNPSTHFLDKPQTYLRAVRLAAQLGFTIEETLLTFLEEHHEIFHSNTENRIQNEGYRMLLSDYPLFAFYYLQKIGLIQGEVIENWQIRIPNHSNNTQAKAAYIAYLVGKETFFEFIDLFRLSHHMKEKINHLYPYLTDEKTPKNPKALSEALLLKRYQFQNDPTLIKNYMLQLKK